jgi:hypothetical protein
MQIYRENVLTLQLGIERFGQRSSLYIIIRTCHPIQRFVGCTVIEVWKSSHTQIKSLLQLPKWIKHSFHKQVNLFRKCIEIIQQWCFQIKPKYGISGNVFTKWDPYLRTSLCLKHSTLVTSVFFFFRYSIKPETHVLFFQACAIYEATFVLSCEVVTGNWMQRNTGN